MVALRMRYQALLLPLVSQTPHNPPQEGSRLKLSFLPVLVKRREE